MSYWSADGEEFNPPGRLDMLPTKTKEPDSPLLDLTLGCGFMIFAFFGGISIVIASIVYAHFLWTH